MLPPEASQLEPEPASPATAEAASRSPARPGGRPDRRIALLPDAVIDQIAAGEVVERPASVVKELVENALDAGASHIVVEVEGGGRTSIRVVDNGCGMSPADARLALARHATSKLRGIDDLVAIATMGFRGEALPSIASVSRLTLTTRTLDDAAATRLTVEAGRLLEVAEVGAPVGTVVEVRDLLRNVPARLKFLKGDGTEASHITEAITRLAMAHPQVHFRLRHGGRTAIDVPLAPSRLARVQALLGARIGRAVAIASGREQGVTVEAFLAPPELAQTTSRGVQLYVGRRAVRDRGLLQALTMGYGELVPRGRYPVAVVFVDPPGEEVDVNVHPQKLEVRFADAQAVFAAVRHAVRRAVAEAPWLDEGPGSGGGAPVRMYTLGQHGPGGVGGGAGRASEIAVGYAARAAETLFSARELNGRGERAAGAGAGASAGEYPRVSFPMGAEAPSTSMVPSPSRVSSPSMPTLTSTLTSTSTPTSTPTMESVGARAGAFFSRLRYLGQLDRTYLLCEGDGELVLIDQHAAHERVAFQRLRERAPAEIQVQRLLFPVTIEVSPAQIAAADGLGAIGFEIEPFGGGTLAIKAMPAGLRADAPGEVVRELLDELADAGGSRAVEERADLMLATIACHSVVRAGDALSSHEAQALLDSMDGIDFRAHCPHGRPVLLRISIAELARRFGR